VFAPVLVALTMTVAGAVVLARTARGRPLRATVGHWCAVLAGAVIIVFSFAKDYGQTMEGRMPERFSWLVFGAGLLLALLAFVHALRRPVVAPDGAA
jgi:amino acid transporter